MEDTAAAAEDPPADAPADDIIPLEVTTPAQEEPAAKEETPAEETSPKPEDAEAGEQVGQKLNCIHNEHLMASLLCLYSIS